MLLMAVPAFVRQEIVLKTIGGTAANTSTLTTTRTTLSRLAPTLFTFHPSTQMRVKVKPPAGGFNTVINEMCVAHAATSGDAYDADSDIVNLKFAASDAVTLTGGSPDRWSDWTAFALISGRALVFSFDLASGSRYHTASGLPTGYGSWFQNSVQQADDQNRTGTYTAQAGLFAIITEIQVALS